MIEAGFEYHLPIRTGHRIDQWTLVREEHDDFIERATYHFLRNRGENFGWFLGEHCDLSQKDSMPWKLLKSIDHQLYESEMCNSWSNGGCVFTQKEEIE